MLEFKDLNSRERNNSTLHRNLATLPLLLDQATSENLPLILANNITIEDFVGIRDEIGNVSRFLVYEEGTVFVKEVPSIGHDAVAEIVKDYIKEQTNAALGPGTLDCYGTSDLSHGQNNNKIAMPDAEFMPSDIPALTSPTLLIQIVDSSHLNSELDRDNSIFAAANNVQGMLLVKLYRFIRVAVPGIGAVRNVGVHSFSDIGFQGDPAPGGNETTPISRMVFIYRRRGGNTSIVDTGLGPSPPGINISPRDDVNIQLPNIPQAGGNPGPYIVATANYLLHIPWADIYFVPGGGALPVGLAAALQNAPAAGSRIDPFVIWGRLNNRMRYGRLLTLHHLLMVVTSSSS